MRLKAGFLLVICALLGLSGCGKSNKGVSVDQAYMTSLPASRASSRAAVYPALARQASVRLANAAFLADADKYAEPPQRFIAVSHKLEVISSESALPTAWQSVIDYCGTIRCEVISSTISTKTRLLPPSGNISLRMAPDDVKKFLAYVEKQGRVVEHSTQSVDITSDVIDTEAKIKNLTSFRDNLRGMLAKPATTVKDSVEIQQQLTDVQSQLDSETAQRKVLANETEKVAIEISFRVELVEGRRSGFAQIWNAFRESGDVLADSIYWMILAIVAILPWSVLIVPLVWLTVRLWRRFFGTRSSSVQKAVVPGG